MYYCKVNIIDKNIERVVALCNKYKVSTLFVFGSVLTKKFNKDSDIDFIVDFTGVDLYDYADNYFDFKFSLEKLFNRDIDLLEEKGIRNPYLRKSIDSTKRVIYG